MALKSLRGAAKAAGLPYSAVFARLKRGWPRDRALSTPLRQARFPDGPQYFRRRNLWKAHGMLLEEYEARLAEQGGCCAICRRPESAKWTRKWRSRIGFVVDHCHRTNTIRRILCHSCNVGLGLFADDPTVLRTAAAYLEEYRGDARQDIS